MDEFDGTLRDKVFCWQIAWVLPSLRQPPPFILVGLSNKIESKTIYLTRKGKYVLACAWEEPREAEEEGTQTRKANEENNEISVTLLGTFVLPIHTWYWYLGTGHQQKIMAAT